MNKEGSQPDSGNQQGKQKRKRTDPICIAPPKNKEHIDDGSDRIHPDLPHFPIFWGNVGPRKSGKTVLFYSVLQNKEGLYGKAFKKENIVIYSPMLTFDNTLMSLKLPHMYSKNTEIDLLLKHCVQEQAELKEEDDLDHVLVVLDDITQVMDAWRHLTEQGYIGRHYQMHFMYIAHKFSSIPRGVRTQTTQWTLFKPHEGSEMKWILDMFSNRETRNAWQAALRRVWSQKHDFVFINFEEEEFDRVYRHGFHEPLFTPEERAEVDCAGGLKFRNDDAVPDTQVEEVNKSSTSAGAKRSRASQEHKSSSDTTNTKRKRTKK